jgi:hypothetical protein
MSRRALLLIAAVVVLGGAWYAFRPERIFIDKTVSESLPGDSAGAATAAADDAPMPLLAGDFHSNAHDTKGTATIYRLGDGRLVLRLTEFETSNGPDVQIYLVAAEDVNDDETVADAGFVNLGAMKGNIGDQNYDVPVDIDLAKYRAVSIWCRRFSVNFGAAPLTPAS